jgi:3-hydroxyisobutyrate dehydrogenase
MTRSYYFAGNETVGAYVRGIMQEHEWLCEGEPEDAEVIITYFTSTTALEDAYFAGNGLIKRAMPKTLLIDLSANTPTFARELAAVAQVNDMRPVESPIVVLDTAVDDAFADKANIASFVAGDKADVEAATEVLELLIGNAQIMGAAGSAQLARAALTVQVTAQIVAAVEADALFRAVQNDPSSEGDIDGHVGAASPYAEQVLSAVVEKRFSGSYTIEMFMGEVSAAMTAADDIELVLPQLEAGMRVLELLAVIGGIDMAPAALGLLYRGEDEVREAGLDWSRANDYYSRDANDEFDDCDDVFDDGADDGAGHGRGHDHECCGGHGHGHGHDHECTCGHDHAHDHGDAGAYPQEGDGAAFGDYDDGYRSYSEDFFSGRI